MILLGIDSSLASIEVTISTLFEIFPRLTIRAFTRHLSFAGVFLCYFAVGLAFCLNSGQYWIEIFNSNAGSWAIMIIGFFELMAISWFYGFKNIRIDIRCMLGRKYTNWTFHIWAVLWGVVIPVILIFLVVVSFTQIERQTLGDYYTFPEWTLPFGQSMTVSVCLGILFWPIYAIIDAKYFKKRSFKSLFLPDFEAFMPEREVDKRAVMLARGHIRDDSGVNDNISIKGDVVQF